jgi:hypothetical protein
MPIIFILAVFALSFAFPQFMRFTFVAPILGFTFGGFFWALGGFFDLSSPTLSSFATYFVLAYAATILATRPVES